MTTILNEIQASTRTSSIIVIWAVVSVRAATGCGYKNDHPDVNVTFRYPDAASNSQSVEAVDADTTTSRTETCGYPLQFAYGTIIAENGAATPSCSLDEDGSLVLSYDNSYCGSPAPFRGCSFAWQFDMQPFDPCQDHSGLYEVFFCVEGKLNEAINIWYEEDGFRFFLPLLGGGRSLSGCMRVYLNSGDVNGGSPWNSDARPFCSSTGSPPASCATIEVAEGAGGVDASTRPDFAKSMLSLMAEWCDPSATPTAVPGSSVKVTLKSFVYHPAKCICSTDADCQTGEYCSHIGWSPNACCQSNRCPGICRTGP